MTIKYEVETRFDDALIAQDTYLEDTFKNDKSLLYRRLIRLEEQGVRDALISLGWTPPKGYNTC